MTGTHCHFPAFKGELTRLDGGETAPSPAQVHHPDNLHQLLANHAAAPSWLPPPPAPDASPLNSPTLLVISGCLWRGRGAGTDLSQWCHDPQAQRPVWRRRHCRVPTFPMFGLGYSCPDGKATPLGLLGSKRDKAPATLRAIPRRPRGSNLLPGVAVLPQVVSGWGWADSTNLKTDAGILGGQSCSPGLPWRGRTPSSIPQIAHACSWSRSRSKLVCGSQRWPGPSAKSAGMCNF